MRGSDLLQQNVHGNTPHAAVRVRGRMPCSASTLNLPPTASVTARTTSMGSGGSNKSNWAQCDKLRLKRLSEHSTQKLAQREY
eukprot:4474218-Amphidinium_carterae.1